MRPKEIQKILVDVAMTAVLLCLMAYLLLGEALHEWLGVAMFGLWVFHHGLNWNWHKNLAKGRYTPLRLAQTGVDLLILLSMVGLMVSGVMMSREVFAFLPVRAGIGFARTLHLLASYWGFLWIGVHLGLHWGMVMGRIRKAAGIQTHTRLGTWPLRALAVLLAGFGLSAFIRHDIASYLLLRTQFVFFDMAQPLPLFFLDYLGMLGLWAAVGYYGGKLLQKAGRKRARPREDREPSPS